MADEMHRRAVVGVLGELGCQLLHPVFAAAVHTGGDGLTHGVGAVHFCGGAEQDFLWVTSRGEGGGLHLAADFGDVFGDRHKNSSFCLDWEPEFTLKKGQRKAYAPLPFLRHAVAAAAFSGFMGARVEMACL